MEILLKVIHSYAACRCIINEVFVSSVNNSTEAWIFFLNAISMQLVGVRVPSQKKEHSIRSG